MAALQDTHDTGELPEDYQPSEYDAIVGWARQNYHHGTFALGIGLRLHVTENSLMLDI